MASPIYSQITSNKRRTIVLITVFVVLVLVLGWVFGEVQGYGFGGLTIAGIIAIVLALTSYYSGDKVALFTSGAKGPIEKRDFPNLYRMVDNLAISQGMRTPKVYVIEDPAINAFATGRDPTRASIAVTTGALQKLENQELEGVLAHELSHVKNYDIRVMTLVVVLVGTVAIISDMFLRFRFLGGNRRREGGQFGAVLVIVGIVLAILSPLIAKIIQLAISRKREYLADASGALMTRYPDGLADALEKIHKENRPLQKASNATAHLFIASPFAGKRFAHMFSTHPPVEDRVNILRAMTRG